MEAMSSKCLLFPIFIHKVDIENCCVNNSKVAINVPFLITYPVYCCVILGGKSIKHCCSEREYHFCNSLSATKINRQMVLQTASLCVR